MQLVLSTVCLALTSVVIGNAYYQKQQFYPAVVHITKSNPSMAVIYIQFFVIVFMFGKLLRKIFLGTLRAAEFEHLLERFWYALTETCLAFTVFRDDFNPRFVGLFTVLLFLKSFHWLAEERVDYMERSPVLGVLFHIRVASLLMVLGLLDHMLLMHAYESTIERGPTVQVVFGFEYAILLTMVASTAIKYVLHALEMRTDTPWENKAVFLLYTELVIGLIKVVLYVLFVVIMAKIYALPMFVFRPMFFTIRNFKKALSDVIMSRRAIRNMNTLYPDATPEELQLSDNICIICREDMISHSKKLPCGHIFHTTCLRSWFQRQQTCPTCRLNILSAPAANSTALPRAAEAPAAAADAAAPEAAPPQPAAAAAGPLPMDGTHINRIPAAAQLPNIAAGANVQARPYLLPTPPLMMAPPFSFVAPYAVPPPPMPTDLTHFTDEELHAMEGNLRRNAEERIKLLRNITLMLDATQILMNNYQLVSQRMQLSATAQNNAAAAAAAAAAFEAQPSTSAAAAANLSCNNSYAQVANDNASNATQLAQELQKLAETELSASSSDVAATTDSASSEVTIEDLGTDDDDDEASTSAAALAKADSHLEPHTADTGKLNELRKRRLKFLQQQNESTASQSTTSNTD